MHGAELNGGYNRPIFERLRLDSAREYTNVKDFVKLENAPSFKIRRQNFVFFKEEKSCIRSLTQVYITQTNFEPDRMRIFWKIQFLSSSVRRRCVLGRRSGH